MLFELHDPSGLRESEWAAIGVVGPRYQLYPDGFLTAQGFGNTNDGVGMYLSSGNTYALDVNVTQLRGAPPHGPRVQVSVVVDRALGEVRFFVGDVEQGSRCKDAERVRATPFRVVALLNWPGARCTLVGYERLD
jgi:hypothetical protein